MSRPIWNGHISFGLVHIPVSLYAVEQRNDLHLKMVDSRNKSGIRYERINEVTGEEVPWDQIVKGYEYEDGKFILLTDEELKRAAPEATQSIDIDSFVPTDAISPQYFDKPYYLVPAKRSEKPYALLREALRKSGRTGIAKVVIRTRQYLAAISVRDKALILDLLRFHQELREAPEDKLPATSLKVLKISEKELEMAEQLIETMESDWKPEQYKDEYRETLMKWIHKQIEGGATTAVGEVEEPEDKEDGNVIDMMALLKQSMEKHAEAKKSSPPKKRKKA